MRNESEKVWDLEGLSFGGSGSRTLGEKEPVTHFIVLGFDFLAHIATFCVKKVADFLVLLKSGTSDAKFLIRN